MFKSIFEQLDPICDDAEALDGLIKERATFLERYELSIERLASSTAQEGENGSDGPALIDVQEVTVDATPPENPRVISLSGQLESMKSKRHDLEHEMEKYESDIKAFLAEHHELIPAIVGVLRNIEFLCGKVVKAPIREISAWEMSVAAEQWPQVRNDIRDKGPLAGIDAALVEMAFTVLGEKPRFLEAYNGTAQVRRSLTELDELINEAERRMDDLLQHNEKPVQKPDDAAREKRRLEKGAKRMERNIGEIDNRIATTISRLSEGAGLPQGKVDWGAFWTELFGKRCKPLLDELEKCLQSVDAINGALRSDMAVQVRLSTVLKGSCK